MLKEFCAENFTEIPLAIQAGAKRIELCDNLAVGGTTPSYGVVRHTLKHCKDQSIPVMIMIRPRGGNFIYTPDEIEIMKTDIIEMVKLKTDGIVLGCLTTDNRIDRSKMKELLELNDGCEVTFHMAFDQIPLEFQFEEIDWLIDQKVTRVLTHGGLVGTLQDHSGKLNELIDYAAGRIEILPGGGVTYQNVSQLAQLIQADQFHGTKIVDF